MANFQTIRRGSSGADTKRWQQHLIDQGYDVGKAGADGIFGDATYKATLQYQKDNGLNADGIVGGQTWGTYKQPTAKASNKSSGFTYDPFKYASYQASESVTEAGKQADKAKDAVSNYGDFSYSNQQSLDDIINKILNREKFSYDLNGDALYQQYKDKYIQQGKMAMQDTMGQAAAMTGGYGNSYAATAGNQAYQASLENLNDIVPELYQMAYDKYNQEGQDMINQYSLLSDDRATEYGEHMDKYNQLVADRDYYANLYDSERNYDYNKYTDGRDFAYGTYADDKSYAYNNYRDEIEDKQWQAQFDEAKRQYDEQMAFQREQYADQKAQAAAAAAAASKSSGGGGGKSYNNGGSSDGEFHKAVFSRVDDNGNYVYYINGKEYTYAQGVNPYTGTKNSDINNGAFTNGYQPNNIKGKKLSKSGITDVVNGVTQNVWQTSDGQKWIWDGTQNKYLKYED